MEQIKVNMTPCGFTPTIHASQNDNATRKWAFDLYDENGKIDSSSIKEQMIFDSRVGGTEQILPENTSDPTTSPIIADIQYPDSLRSEQTFLYRESPTQEDGQAKIKRIQGNTVVFNQLVRNGNFANTSEWTANGVSASANNNIATVTVSNTSTAYFEQRFNSISGHKYFVIANGFVDNSSANGWFVRVFYNGTSQTITQNLTKNSWVKCTFIFDCTVNSDTNRIRLAPTTNSIGDKASLKNVMLFDLTLMGIDNLTTITEVEQWLSTHIGYLPYYAYTSGKLLPFLGTELKTTGFNQWDEVWELGGISSSTGANYVDNNIIRSKNYIPILPSTQYFFKCASSRMLAFFYDGNQNYLGYYGGSSSLYPNTNPIPMSGTVITTPQNACLVRIRTYDVGSTYNNDICINISSSENGKYEPYTESTINLPTLNYFPTGMKSAGTVYDELKESKAVTRVAKIEINGTTAYATNYSRTNGDVVRGFNVTNPKPPINNNTVANVLSVVNSMSANGMYNSTMSGVAMNTAGRIDICIFGVTSIDALTTYLNNNPITVYYELATTSEQSITTASLVTEKGEAPLYYDDELIADCNETISSESGIFDAKIKLMTDETIYSQKIQLHVERKP